MTEPGTFFPRPRPSCVAPKTVVPAAAVVPAIDVLGVM